MEGICKHLHLGRKGWKFEGNTSLRGAQRPLHQNHPKCLFKVHSGVHPDLLNQNFQGEAQKPLFLTSALGIR